MDVLQLHVPKQRDEALRNVQGMIAGTTDSCHVSILAKDGTRIEVETKVTRGWWNGSEVLIGVTRDITERKVAEMELKESEQKFRSLVEYSLEGILILDFSGNVLFANNSAAHMIEVDDGFGLSGRNVMEFIAPESREDVIKDFIQVAQGHDAYIAHYHAISAKGKKIFVESIGKVFTYEGKPADLLSIRDITEQKRAKDALLESSRKYTELFELGSEAIFLIDNETGAILEANAAASEMYGYLRDVLLTMKNMDLSAEREDTRKFTTETTEGTVRVTLRHHRRSDGTVFPVEIIGRFFTWNERPVHIAAIRDITERKRAEEALKESHDRFEQIAGQSREIIWEMDPDGLFSYVSSASYAIIGFTPEELIKKKHFYDLYPKEEREAFKASILKAFSEQRAFHDFVNILQTKDGQNVWMSMNGMPVFDEYNNFLGYRGSGSDITGRKQAEEIRTRFGRILESSLNEIYFFDAQTLRFVDVNHGARENIGYTMDELRTMTPLDITTEYTKESFETLLSTLRTGEKEIQVIFTVHKRKDGSLYPVEVHLQYAGNEVSPVFVAIILDITERRQTEEALRLANWKLNLLTGITRHDINNQMTVLRGYISLLEMKQTDPVLNEYIQKMDMSAQRISSMIQFTKEYDEIGITLPVWQEIRTLVASAAKEISFGKIQVKNDLPAGMEIFSEPLIFKVFYNLMDNAVRYGETIKNIRFFVENRNGDRIIVCEDDGVGVPESEKEKIFLRGVGKNTGMGLALTQEILEITGISIEETGEPGKGARFEIVVLKGMWRFVERK
jgi:PAS domain S-box-containing protein